MRAGTAVHARMEAEVITRVEIEAVTKEVRMGKWWPGITMNDPGMWNVLPLYCHPIIAIFGSRGCFLDVPGQMGHVYGQFDA